MTTRVRHPSFPGTFRDVPDSHADAWLEAGWLPEADEDTERPHDEQSDIAE